MRIKSLIGNKIKLTFFSGTDTATLREEGRDRNNFVSLIVNNAGTYTAAITRRIKTKHVSESVSYEFFCDGEKTDTRDYVNDADEIEWFHLNIEKEDENHSFPDMDARLKEISRQKEAKDKLMDLKKRIMMTQPEQPIVNRESELPFREQDIIYSQSVNSETIESIVRQLVTCSIIIPNESKIGIDKWVKNMPALCEKRFGKGDAGMKKFKEWADSYIEFLTWNVEDKDLEAEGFLQEDIQSICAHDLIEALTKLPENNYIRTYIDELEKYLLL